ncbi:hypothetical protein ACF08N_02500 [Streptomyces sp. NPDC015127]|uniref:hypothetical protein n=1 Tax=Streptomyces sp. NPDC015127 TaxID=3364939 RepID=UPI0036F61F45
MIGKPFGVSRKHLQGIEGRAFSRFKAKVRTTLRSSLVDESWIRSARTRSASGISAIFAGTSRSAAASFSRRRGAVG